ncbi:hypothetical protein INS49_009343 [Diaporthe citri]|uniref:uncharacterized protein n=1 Tax=Diaporthe citri TaxID=83186 RepID=UPI001C8268AC|nr:uncharacterized protein INS49_009343 [Diaporthe citri]KAG6361119.1 hypothetical protein INS49_009343 [Diaporthe citri]
MMLRDRPRARRRLPPAHARTHTRRHPRRRNHTPPPSYDNLFPHHSDGREDLETIRARHPPKRPLNAPIPTDSPIEAAYLAGATASSGMLRAVQDETHPYMVIARAAQAISIAASTSQSHAALLAALNTMETHAMLSYEDDERRRLASDDEGARILLVNSIETAVRRALAQAPPSNSFISHHELQSAGLVPPDMTLAARAVVEAVILNGHIYRPSQ